jgi:hypothetical protein
MNQLDVLHEQGSFRRACEHVVDEQLTHPFSAPQATSQVVPEALESSAQRILESIELVPSARAAERVVIRCR